MMLLCSCGLYSYPYIHEPSLIGGTATSGRPYVAILHDGDNDPSVFRGYEIYYKFYNAVTAETDHSRDDKSIFSVSNPDYSALVAAGYKRCRTEKLYKKDTTTPMFKVPTDDRDDDFQLYLDFETIITKDNKQEMQLVYLSDAVPFFRAIQDQHPDSGEPERAGGKSDDVIYKDFNTDDIEAGDSDLNGNDYNNVSLSFYIIGYGMHENHNLYSKPVWLGVVRCWN
ncbi:MAG: hypothetical protein IJT92_07325 [Spirochaetia bacterium]|nr:hypothetical protein [Spirochaetia bacterium]MBR3672149.1 hypothetical protein [Spirochaetia bacterium]